MALPHHFEAGEIAHAQEVNDNFDYLVGIVGSLTINEDLLPPGGFVMGPRHNSQLSAKHDTTGVVDPENGNRAFVHLGWNAEYYDTGFIDELNRPIYAYRRYNTGERASALRVGENGFTVYTTDKTEGDLNSQLEKSFEVRNDGANKYVLLPQNFSIQSYDGPARNSGDYRLTYTIMPDTPHIFSYASVGQGRASYNLTSYGVPANAKAVTMHVSAISTLQVNRGASIRITKASNDPSVSSGFALWFPYRESGTPARTVAQSTSGLVILGEGAFSNMITVDRSHSFTGLTLYITGYYS